MRPTRQRLRPRLLLCREMLRIKRSVAAAFSQMHFNTAVIDAAAVAAGVCASFWFVSVCVWQWLEARRATCVHPLCL